MIKVVGIDAGFVNIGFCRADYFPDQSRLQIADDALRMVQTKPAATKTVRRSSDDYRRAMELAAAVRREVSGVDVAFCEIPSGTQSARSSWALGIALGVLTNVTCPVIQVTPTQTKLAGHGSPTATKEEMIAWAAKKYPKLAWIPGRGKKKGALSPVNEHMADAVAILHAGIQLPDFLSLVSLSQKLSRVA